MPREISSSATAFEKILTTLIVGILFLYALADHLTNFSLETFLKTFVTGLIGFFFVRWALSWKKVQLTDSGLLVSDVFFGRRKEVFIPFGEMIDAKQNIFQRVWVETVVVEFVNPTEFGKKIRFVPKFRLRPQTQHSIVGELNGLIGSNSIVR